MLRATIPAWQRRITPGRAACEQGNPQSPYALRSWTAMPFEINRGTRLMGANAVCAYALC